MNTPTITSHTSRTVSVSWTALTTAADRGGATITSYGLWYAVSPYTAWTEWFGYTTDQTLTSATVTGLTPNTAYKFKVAAENIHGWGTDSALSALQTTDTDVPDAPTNVLTTVSSSGLGVDITWNAITANGAAVTKVKVTIKHQDGTYTSETVNCDGETDSNIVTNRKCTIPFTVLRATPYFLVYPNEVVAKVAGFNSVGWGSESAISTAGATI